MRAVVISNQPILHLLSEFLKRVECQRIIKTFLVGTMTSLNLAIMPRSVGSYKLVLDSEFVEKFVYDMDFPLSGAFGIRELRSVVRLNDSGIYPK